jgi:hypothetical protein
MFPKIGIHKVHGQETESAELLLFVAKLTEACLFWSFESSIMTLIRTVARPRTLISSITLIQADPG